MKEAYFKKLQNRNAMIILKSVKTACMEQIYWIRAKLSAINQHVVGQRHIINKHPRKKKKHISTPTRPNTNPPVQLHVFLYVQDLLPRQQRKILYPNQF